MLEFSSTVLFAPFLNLHHHHTTTILRPFFWDHPGETVPEENFWTLRCKGRLTEADTLTIWLGATPSGLTSVHFHHPPTFLWARCPYALPAAQPTVSKHWRQFLNLHPGYNLKDTESNSVCHRPFARLTFAVAVAVTEEVTAVAARYLSTGGEVPQCQHARRVSSRRHKLLTQHSYVVKTPV